MFRKVIKYTDYLGTQREEEFTFNFTKADIVELNWMTPGGLEALYNRIIQTQDSQMLAEQFKYLIQASYGVVSPDGRRFMKSDEILKNFTETEAYSILYIELATNSDSAAAFVNGIMPRDMVEEALKEQQAKAAEGQNNLIQVPQFNNAQPVPVSAPMPAPVSQPVYSSDPIPSSVTVPEAPVTPLQ